MSAGIPLGSQRDFGCRDFSSWQESCGDTGEIPKKRNSRQPKSRQGSRREAKIPAAKISPDPAANLAKKQKSWRPKSWHDPAAKLTKILAGKQ